MNEVTGGALGMQNGEHYDQANLDGEKFYVEARARYKSFLMEPTNSLDLTYMLPLDCLQFFQYMEAYAPQQEGAFQNAWNNFKEHFRNDDENFPEIKGFAEKIWSPAVRTNLVAYSNLTATEHNPNMLNGGHFCYDVKLCKLLKKKSKTIDLDINFNLSRTRAIELLRIIRTRLRSLPRSLRQILFRGTRNEDGTFNGIDQLNDWPDNEVDEPFANVTNDELRRHPDFVRVFDNIVERSAWGLSFNYVITSRDELYDENAGDLLAFNDDLNEMGLPLTNQELEIEGGEIQGGEAVGEASVEVIQGGEASGEIQGGEASGEIQGGEAASDAIEGGEASGDVDSSGLPMPRIFCGGGPAIDLNSLDGGSDEKIFEDVYKMLKGVNKINPFGTSSDLENLKWFHHGNASLGLLLDEDLKMPIIGAWKWDSNDMHALVKQTGYSKCIVWIYPKVLGKKDGYFPSHNEIQWSLILDWALHFDTEPLFDDFGSEPKLAKEKLVWKSFHFGSNEFINPNSFGFRGGHFIQITI